MVTWKIEWINVSTKPIEGFDKVVLTAGWRVNGVDGEYSATAYGSAGFPQPKDGDLFTPFTDLTQEQVINWVWGNGVDKDEIEASIASQIEAQKNPPIVQPALPWNS